MSKFTGGWLKWHRSIEDHWIAKDIIAYRLFGYILAKANFRDSKTIFEGHIHIVRRGQLITSLRRLAEDLGIDRNAIQRRLKCLAEDSTIETQVRHRGTIITICNYDIYQGDENEVETQTRRESATERDMGAPPNKKERIKEYKNQGESTDVSPPLKSQKPKKSTDTKSFIARYCEVYKARYQTNPVISGKGAGIASRLVKDLGEGECLNLIEAYLSMNEPWYLTKKHDLVTFEQNLNAVKLHSAGPKNISTFQIKSLEDLND